jgi:hypothetical protein
MKRPRACSPWFAASAPLRAANKMVVSLVAFSSRFIDTTSTGPRNA